MLLYLSAKNAVKHKKCVSWLAEFKIKFGVWKEIMHGHR